MRIDDFIMSQMSVFLKIGRFNLDEQSKEEVLKNGLYHVTPSEDVSKKILESQYIRPTKGIMAYGRACAFMFNGTPSIDDYVINAMKDVNDNPYLNPTKVISAVKISPKSKDELANYKVRALADNALMYEGYCVLPPNEAQSVFLVPDLVRDSNGKPVVDPKTGKYTTRFREATRDELSEDNKHYAAKEDYLQFMAQERERMGFKKGNNVISNASNSINSVLSGQRVMGEITRKNFLSNITQIVKRKIAQITTPKLDMSVDEKIQNNMYQYDKGQKNPYRNSKFAKQVADMQAEGLTQLDFNKELEKLTTSDIGKYFRSKYQQIDKSQIVKSKIHGIDHNNRVAINSVLIAMNEGLLEDDKDNKTLDMVLSASYYHDIGRKKGIIVDNFGPHSKNSARKIKNMQLQYADGKQYTDEDKRTLQAITEAHEGKDSDMLKVCKKYKIEPDKVDYVMKLMTVLKDADALDRVRLDANTPIRYKTDLDLKYLRTNTSKRLINASYQLEALSKKVEFDRILAYHTNEQQLGGEKQSKREQFIEGLKNEVIQAPTKAEILKKNIKLKQEKVFARFSKTKVRDKTETEIKTGSYPVL